jgi:hypothetical protein
MKKALILLACAAVVCAAGSSHGQNFTDLNFESAQIIPASTNADGSVNIATANALPGWNAFTGTTQLSVIAYDTPGSVIAPPVSLLGGLQNPAIDGNFEILLHDNGSLAQTALVPANAELLLFDVAFGRSPTPFLVSMDGQDLSYSAIANEVTASGLSYTVYGADISPIACRATVGQTLPLSLPASVSRRHMNFVGRVVASLGGDGVPMQPDPYHLQFAVGMRDSGSTSQRCSVSGAACDSVFSSSGAAVARPGSTVTGAGGFSTGIRRNSSAAGRSSRPRRPKYSRNMGVVP